MLSLKLSSLSIIILLSGCIVVPTYNANISLKQTNQIKQEIHINNVLLVGTGNVASRIFLENLSAEMIHSFEKRGVQSEFSHIGKLPQSSLLKLDSLIKDKFDTYLVFKSSNNSYLDMEKKKFTAYGPGGTTVNGYGNQYSEKFTVTLYNKKEKLQAIWQGDLDVDFDLAIGSRYKQISKLIFDELIKSQVLQN